MLIGLLAGCASTPSDTTTDAPVAETPSTTDTPATETPADEPADEPADAPADEPVDEPADEPAVDAPAAADTVNPETGYSTGGLTLPLCEEKTTLTAFRDFSSTYITNMNDKASSQIFEERTNVHIDWQTYSQTEQFYLFIASEDYTDMIFMDVLDRYTGGFDKGVEDEVLVPGNDYLQYMPNFSRWIESDPEIEKQCKTDTSIIFFNNVSAGRVPGTAEAQPAWIGPMMRSDWVADVGMELPVTFDDWYNILTAWKTELGVSHAMLLSQTGYSTLGYGLTPGFGTVGDFYAENGTTVKYGVMDPGFKEYIELMTKWYAEDLIHPDFPVIGWYAASDFYVTNEMAAFDDQMYTFRTLFPMLNEDPDDDLVAVPFPTKTADEQGSLHFRRVNGICGTSPIFISTAAVDRGVDVLCAKWIDYRFSADGAYVLNYGEEGVTWEMGEDGLPHFTDFYLHNPDGKMVAEMSERYHEMGYGNYYMWIKEYDQNSADVMSAYDVWGDSSSGDWIMPPITMTAEEGETFNEYFSTIQTYVNEMVARIITGAVSIDEWDSVVAEIESMGIEECIEAQQAALDRYNAR